MTMIFRSLNSFLLAKIEGTIGTDAAPVPGSDAIRTEAPAYGYQFESEETNFARGSISASAPIIDGGMVTLRSRSALMSSATPGTTPPDIARLLRGCALGQVLLAADLTGTAQSGAAATITLANSGPSSTDNAYRGMVVEITGGAGEGQKRVVASYVGSTKVATVFPNWDTPPDNTSAYKIASCAVLSPITQGQEALTLYAYLRNSVSGQLARLRKVVGAMGNAQISISTRKIARVDFSYQGMLPSLPEDVADPGAPTYAGSDPRPFVDALAYLGAAKVKFNDFTLDLGNKLANFDDPSAKYGYDTSEVTNRVMTGRINPALTLNATRNAVSDFLFSTSRGVWLCWGGAGSGVSLFLPAIRYTGNEPGSVNDFETEGLPFRAVGDDQEVFICLF